MEYIIGTLVGVIGMFFYERKKRQSAEALNDNHKTKEFINEVNIEVNKNRGLILAEEKRRKELKALLNKTKTENLTNEEIINILNGSSDK